MNRYDLDGRAGFIPNGGIVDLPTDPVMASHDVRAGKCVNLFAGWNYIDP
jgi:hypothetical protein